jgi:hypothetical protein
MVGKEALIRDFDAPALAGVSAKIIAARRGPGSNIYVPTALFFNIKFSCLRQDTFYNGSPAFGFVTRQNGGFDEQRGLPIAQRCNGSGGDCGNGGHAGRNGDARGLRFAV